MWGIDFDPGTNVVNVQVARLRRRLEAWAPDAIRTVVGEGYVLGQVESEAGSAPPSES